MLKILISFIIIILIFSISCSNKTNIELEPNDDNEQSDNNIRTDKEIEVNKNEQKIVNVNEYKSEANDFFQIGIASWYGGKFHGRSTSNGEIYDMYKLTAAHKTLPFNTIVEVVNLENNKKVIVRINDRGPFVKNRIIDLSYKAAKKIGIEDTGTAKVGLRIIKTSDIGNYSNNNPNNSLSFNTDKKYRIQVGAFSIKENAIKIVNKLKEILPYTEFAIYKKTGLFVVITKRYYDEDNIEKIKSVLTNYNIEYIIKE